MIAIRPPMMRVVTRNGSDGIAITSSASTSSEIRIAPSWAVKPQPTVAARAMPATRGAISRVLKYADTKPENAAVPSWFRAAYPWRPTSVPVKKHIAVMTPTVPPMTASAPEPSVTSARIRRISFLYRLMVRGVHASALMKNASSSPRLSRVLSGLSYTERRLAMALTRLRWDELEVDGAHHEVHDEQQHERDHHRLVDGVAHALRAARGVHALVRRDDRGDQPEDERLGHALPEVRQLRERGEARDVRTWGPVLEHDVEDVAARDPDDADEPVEEDGDEHAGQHAGHHEALDGVDAQHHHGVELLADLAGAEVGGDRGAAGAGDEQRGGDRPGLADHGEHGGRPGEGLRAELLDQPADLQRDHRAERDRDQRRGDDGHGGDEPGLLEELPQLEGTTEEPAPDVEAEREQLACGADRGECPAGGQCRHQVPVTIDMFCSKEPGGGVTPFSRHHDPGSRWLRRGMPLDGSSWCGIGGSGGSSWSFSAASSSASFSSDMPIGPTRWALRNCRTTGSSEESSISRGPNIARCRW